MWTSYGILGPSLQGHHGDPCQICFPLLVGDLSAADRGKLQAVLDRASHWGLCAHNSLSLLDLCDQADHDLFRVVVTNLHHVSWPLLAPLRSQTPNLRRRPHPFVFPKRDKFTQLYVLRRLLF